MRVKGTNRRESGARSDRPRRHDRWLLPLIATAAHPNERCADDYNRFSPQYAATGLALKFPISTYPSDAYSAIACGWRGPVSRRTTR
jgi:hypothetical protein